MTLPRGAGPVHGVMVGDQGEPAARGEFTGDLFSI